MSIFEVSKTEEELAKEQAVIISELSNTLLDTLISQHASIFNAVWHNQTSTPQQIFDAMGPSETIKLFQYSHATQTFIKTINPEYTVLVPPYEYEFVDGIIVVGQMLITE